MDGTKTLIESNHKTTTHDVQLPGRLGDPDRSLATDPRADPRMVAALSAFGMDTLAQPLPVGYDSPLQEILPVIAGAEEGFEGFYAALFAGLDPVPGVVSETITIEGPDGDELPLYVHRPAGSEGEDLPHMIHLHGGGMAMLRAGNPGYWRWRDQLAATGMVVVGPEFRNAAGCLGPHPFPAGLDDCAAAFAWMRETLAPGKKIVVSGESGGGNLSLALALRAHRDGWSDQISGVYAMCPYISGTYVDRPLDLPSLYENDQYFISCALLAPLARTYDPEGKHTDDPTCWPLAATVDDLRGLPPHVISVNELDPLRDEGLAYLRRLQAASVSAYGRIVAGTSHGGDIVLSVSMPEVAAATLRDIRGFAGTL
jgi:acetyl esterase